MKKILLLNIIIHLTLSTFSQTMTRVKITGHIYDKETTAGLADATVICLLSKDSSKIGLTFTDKNGNFIFDSIPQMPVYLYITYIGYSPTTHMIKQLANENTVYAGNIPIQKKSLTLTQIEIIQTRNQATIKKDTVEFNADYFKLDKNELIEGLLKKIPGIQIDNDGTIKINGRTANALMINGRPVFNGEDLKIITRNLQADMIEKIQLVQRKDPLSKTGNLDEDQNVINLTIKETKQNQINGQIAASIGTSNRFGIKANLNRFGTKRQIIFIANGDNTNEAFEALSIPQAGITQKWNTGLDYSEELDNKLAINADIVLEKNKLEESSSSIRRTFISDSMHTYNQKSIVDNNLFGARFTAKIEYKIDSLQKITLDNFSSFNDANENLKSTYESTDDKAQLLNKGNTNNLIKDKKTGTYSSLQFEKKFKKENRKINIMINYGNNLKRETSVNSSYNITQHNNGEKSMDTINTSNNIPTTDEQLSLFLNYVEPISSKGSILLSWSNDLLSSKINKNTYSYNESTNLYDIHVDSLSVYMKSKITREFLKVSWLQQFGKYSWSISLNTGTGNIKNHVLDSGNIIRLDIISLLPGATFTYSFNNRKNLRIIYNRLVQLPEISDMAPIIDNRNPLYIKIGNPNLKPTYTQNINLSYNSLIPEKMRFFSLSLYARTISQQVILGISYDSTGKQVGMPINANGASNFGLSSNYSFRVKKIGTFDINSNVSFTKNTNYINGIWGSYNNLNIRNAIKYNYNYQKVLAVSLSGTIMSNNMQYYTITSNNNNISYNILLNLVYNFPFDISINYSLLYDQTAGQAAGYNPKILIMNASISKSLFPHNNGAIELKGFDLLNKSTSVNRIIGENYIEDIQKNTLQRFFILKLSYFPGRNK